MGLVRGRDAAVGVEHNDGIAADSTVGTYSPYPLISFDHKIDALPLEESEELLAQGARETVAPSQKQVVGTMVLRPRYDDQAFLKILCNAMGGTETRVPTSDVEKNIGSVFITTNTHIIEAGGDQPRQWLQVNLGTAGLRIDSTCKFSKMVWEHSARATPKVSIDILGIGPAVDGGAAAALSLHAGLDPMKATDLERVETAPGNGSAFKWRPSPGAGNWVDAPNITSMKITLDHHMEQVETYVNSASSFSELGGGEKTREVTVELEGQMPAGLDSTEDHPYYSFVNATAFGLDVIYASGETASPPAIPGFAKPHRIRLWLGSIVPVDGSTHVAGPGVLTWNVKGIAELSTEWYTNGTSASGLDHEIPAAGTDFRILFQVDAAEEALAEDSTPYYCHQHVV